MLKKYLKYIKHYFLIRNNGIFDAAYYLKNNPDVQRSHINPIWHYVVNGWKEGRNPSQYFDTDYYLTNNEDVRKSGCNPLIHYIFYGQHEKRMPTPTPPETKWVEAREDRPWKKHIHQYPQGLNVIGFLQTVKGLAEVIRYNRYAYEAVGINYSLIDYEYSIPEHQKIIPLPNHKFINDFRFNTNIFHINPPQLPFVWENFTEEALTGRYSIGVWYWELPELPDDWCFAFDLVDEVWVASEHVLKAVSSKTEKPVIKIPPCVYLEDIPNKSRGDFHLPEQPFLFMCAYDVLSSQERKNPMGAIKAFKRAFSQNDPDVGLVIKVNNAQDHPLGMREIKEELAGYTNIYYIDDILGRDSLNALINLIDAYVSLHRAEGFGLVPAEAMVLGKPVVMTEWSGNLELMTPDNSCGVNYELKQLERDYGPYKKGQVWAEPDIDHAAHYMKKLYQNPSYYNQTSCKAQKFIRDKFSPKNIGEKIITRLQALELHT
jgi:glycosyltransferase involved in cell wall biosynthesis